MDHSISYGQHHHVSLLCHARAEISAYWTNSPVRYHIYVFDYGTVYFANSEGQNVSATLTSTRHVFVELINSVDHGLAAGESGHESEFFDLQVKFLELSWSGGTQALRSTHGLLLFTKYSEYLLLPIWLPLFCLCQWTLLLLLLQPFLPFTSWSKSSPSHVQSFLILYVS